MCLHPPRSPTREAECRSSGKYQARRLPGVHPEYSTTASGRGSNGSCNGVFYFNEVTLEIDLRSDSITESIYEQKPLSVAEKLDEIQ
ncbi:hypothetical protein TNCV_2227961 [Trichonephila clavipes]|nr:hypothetical protein TNCV_2227961 [Trichonephila clavipes]